MDKLIALQWLRGGAAVLVAWVHCIYLASARKMPSFQTDWGHIYEWGAVGVDIFFVISGFIVTLTATRASSVRMFMANRARRIFPLYFVATIAYVLIAPNEFRSFLHLIASLLLLAPLNVASPMPVLGPGWSLSYEFVFYAMIAAALLWKEAARGLPERILIIVVGAVLVGAAFDFFPPFNILGNPLALEFALGVAIGWIWMKRPVLPSWATSTLFVSGSVMLMYTALFGFGPWFYANYAIQGEDSWERVRVWGFPASLLVAAAVFRPQISASKGRLFTLLGDASYSIYLTHVIVIAVLHRHDAWMERLSGDAVILVATVTCIVFGIIAYATVEKPLSALVHRRTKARQKQGGAVQEAPQN